MPKELLARSPELLGPRGIMRIRTLELQVTDEAGRVRQIRDVLKRMPKESPLQFGPVIERVVNAVAEGKGGEGLDLVGGKLVDAPNDFLTWSAEKQNKWSTENNVDLLVGFVVQDGGPLVGGDGRALVPERLKLAAVGCRWDRATKAFPDAWDHVTGDGCDRRSHPPHPER